MSAASYDRLFRAAAGRGPDNPIRIELPSASKARNLRRMLYAYRPKIASLDLGILAATVQLRVVGRFLYASAGASLETPYAIKIDAALPPEEK